MTKNIFAFILIGSLLFLAACAPLHTPTPQPNSLPSVTAGISIQGKVRLNTADGPGLAGVKIYAKGGYGATDGPVQLLATTDSDGNFWNGNAIPLMIVYAELDGYTFEPVTQEYMGTGQSCESACDFIAHPIK